MMWRLRTIGEFIDAGHAAIQTGPFGTQLRASDYVEFGTPVINVRNIGYGRMKADKLEYVGGHTCERLAVHLLQRNDIVFGRKGAVDRHLLVTEDLEGAMQGSDCIRLRFAGSEISPHFVSYAFLQRRHQDWMLTQSGNKATMASLNHDVVRRIPLHVPPGHVQARIVDVLSAYDALIENNRRRMALLEEAARHLYQEWFVRLRFPGYECARIVNGVPEGWASRRLADCVTFSSGGTPSKSRDDFWRGDIPWVSSGEMTQPRLHDSTHRLTLEGLDAGSRLVPRNTILAVVRGMSLATEFRLALAARAVAFNQDLKALTCKSGFTPEFLFSSLDARREYIRTLATEASHGTKKLEMRVVEAVQITVPDDNLQRRFVDSVAPMNKQWDNLYQQVRRLRAARDLLLPRLMSGEIGL